MSTLLTMLLIGALSTVGSVVAVCLVLLVADRSRARRERRDEK